jgi:hypothetical protein
MIEALLRLVVWFAMHCIGISSCLANGNATTVDSFLEKWEQASRDIQTLDTYLTIYHYDFVFYGDQPKISEGQFYTEASGVGRYDDPDSDEVIIWNEDQILLLSPSKLTCKRFSKADIQSILKSKSIYSLWGVELFPWMPVQPQEFLPLIVDIDSERIRNRFAFSLSKAGKDFLVRASPKLDDDKTRFSMIEVIVNEKTYLTSAIQLHSPNGRVKTAYVMNRTKINAIPADRDEMIEPDLVGFRVKGE